MNGATCGTTTVGAYGRYTLEVSGAGGTPNCANNGQRFFVHVGGVRATPFPMFNGGMTLC
ncbi:MAG: hypothetical protein U0531_11525 [Dehalococcoidia bacterium]